MSLRVVPITTAVANRYVAALHRHHGACPPALVHFTVGLVEDGALRGVAICGRPANRNSDDGATAEVLRTATDGVPNGCSFLLGACSRIAKEMGFARVITYTLDTESGVSPRAAGWVLEEEGIESWWHRYPAKNRADRRTVINRPHHGIRKRRWSKQLGAKEAWSWSVPAADIEASLFDNPLLVEPYPLSTTL